MLFLLLLLFSSSTHNLHLTYSKAAVDGSSLVVKIRFFPDDFDLMLSGFHARDMGGFKHNGDADSLLIPVLEKDYKIVLNGKPSKGEILQSGTDGEMCWYMLSFKAETKISSLVVDNRLLFNLYSDQKNLLTLQEASIGKNHSFYAVKDASEFNLTLKN